MLTLLDRDMPDAPFPPAENALDEPNGLLAVGGCLSVQRLVNAYRHGIFPWYAPGEPLLWWSPNPRLVLFPPKLHSSSSLKKALKKNLFEIRFDTAFPEVIEACSKPRKNQNGTWITDEMKQAYIRLHKLGLAHSAEAWSEGRLVGGLYGLAIGQVFFGESMFHVRSNASKIAFSGLVENLKRWNYQLIDCQVRTEHLLSLGAEEIPREQFIGLLDRYCNAQPHMSAWRNP